jgi:hypothetical protein
MKNQCAENDGLLTNIFSCARCGKDRKLLCFARLNNSPDRYSHWAMCPNTKQPILLRIVSSPELETD